MLLMIAWYIHGMHTQMSLMSAFDFMGVSLQGLYFQVGVHLH